MYSGDAVVGDRWRSRRVQRKRGNAQSLGRTQLPARFRLVRFCFLLFNYLVEKRLNHNSDEYFELKTIVFSRFDHLSMGMECGHRRRLVIGITFVMLFLY